MTIPLPGPVNFIEVEDPEQIGLAPLIVMVAVGAERMVMEPDAVIDPQPPVKVTV